MILQVKGLVKVFPAPPLSGGEAVRALAGVDMEAGPGVTALAGPNASGKTTLLRTLAGLLEADGGTVLTDGAAADSGRLRALASYCPPVHRSFYFRLSAAENLRFFGVLAGLKAEEALSRAKALAPRLGLALPDLDRRFDRLSEGNQQKISLIRAFLRRAPLLLLDEPFSGLDGIACRGLLALISGAGIDSTVLVTSHSRELLETAAVRTLRLENGRAVQGGGS